LPCFWGITPGKSTHQDAQKILEQFTSISNLTGFRIDGGSVAPMYEEGDTTLVANAGFLSNEAVVNHIAFFAGEQKAVNTTNGAGFEPVFDSQTFGERLSYYMLPHLLADQGIPTSVMMAPHGGEAGFGILLLFPEKGILINYTAQMYSEGLKISGCPANAHIQMELYPSGTSESFYEALKLTDWSTRLNYYKPLEEVTSLSIEEFYQTFKEPTDGCVETSAEFWPTPVP
jgi:hypothetical protein